MTSRDDCSTPGVRSGREPDDVAGHVVGCNPCGDSLDSLQAQGNALKYLSTGGEAVSATSVVERVLAETARAGREKLADLLYELAKACLVLDPEAEERVRRMQEPRDVAEVGTEANRLAARVGSDSETGSIPLSQPVVSRALGTSEACIRILADVEGRSLRQQLFVAQLHLLREEFDTTENICRALSKKLLSDTDRQLVITSLVRALIRQDRFVEALECGESEIRDHPDSLMLIYNMAVASAWLRENERFDRHASHVRSISKASDPEWCTSMIHHDAQTLASQLGCDSDRILAAFGRAN